jgi:hypothetical protein
VRGTRDCRASFSPSSTLTSRVLLPSNLTPSSRGVSDPPGPRLERGAGTQRGVAHAPAAITIADPRPAKERRPVTANNVPRVAATYRSSNAYTSAHSGQQPHRTHVATVAKGRMMVEEGVLEHLRPHPRSAVRVFRFRARTGQSRLGSLSPPLSSALFVLSSAIARLDARSTRRSWQLDFRSRFVRKGDILATRSQASLRCARSRPTESLTRTVLEALGVDGRRRADGRTPLR